MKELPKYQANQNPTYQIDSLKEETNKKMFAQAGSLVNKLLFSPRVNYSNSHPVILFGVTIGVVLSDFAQDLHREIGDNPDILFSSFDGTGISPALVLYQSAQTKEK